MGRALGAIRLASVLRLNTTITVIAGCPGDPMVRMNAHDEGCAG
jgi:hypothetical protein